jgi:hypothetical protein
MNGLSQTTLGATDLFALLDRDFRRRSRNCRQCEFSLPYRVFSGRDQGNWSVMPSETCSHTCKLILDDLVHEYQSAWRLSQTGRFHAVAR